MRLGLSGYGWQARDDCLAGQSESERGAGITLRCGWTRVYSAMLHAAKRITLVAQVADIVRRALDEQVWSERLPPETDLAHQLQVSRMTLRQALQILVKEKRLVVENGKRARIAARPNVRAKGTRRVIGIISPAPIDASSRYASYYESYRTLMQSGGVDVDFYFGARFYGNRPGEALKALVGEAKADLWILLGSTARLQQWFFERGLPAIVDGSCHPGIVLPALDIDYRAACRHAAGTLAGLGHRRIAFLQTKARAGGDVASEAGFIEGCGREAHPQVVACDDSVAAVCSALARLFRGAERPTAILAQQWLPFTVLTWLRGKNIRVPQEVSLIARDDQPHLDRLVPAVARYGLKPDVYTQRLIRMTWSFFNGTLQPKQEFFIPDFIKGESLAPAARD